MINVKIRILRGLLEEAINNIDAGTGKVWNYFKEI